MIVRVELRFEPIAHELARAARLYDRFEEREAPANANYVFFSFSIHFAMVGLFGSASFASSSVASASL